MTKAKAKEFYETCGAGSNHRLIATAIVGVASGNVTGSMDSFIKAAAFFQAYATSEVKFSEVFSRQKFFAYFFNSLH